MLSKYSKQSNENEYDASSEEDDSNKDNTLRIVTWNINGIRSRIFNNKTSTQLPKNKDVYPETNSAISNLITETNANIICLQETRCDEKIGKGIILPGYDSYFNSSKLEDARGPNRYSGTAIYTKLIPNKVSYSVPEYDDKEGRIIVMYFDDFVLINVYSPNSGTNYDNKILFQDSILNFINDLDKSIRVIYCGDFNIAIDTHFDKSKVSLCPGIYKHELDYYTLLKTIGMIDSKMKEDDIVYTWWDQRSKRITVPNTKKETNIMRYKNKGWRLDYIFTSGFSYAKSKVLKHIGEENCPHASDHAPVFGVLKYF